MTELKSLDALEAENILKIVESMSKVDQETFQKVVTSQLRMISGEQSQSTRLVKGLAVMYSAAAFKDTLASTISKRNEEL
jgi:hypothetical protein